MSLVLLAERRPPVLQDGKVFVSDQQDLMKKLCQSEVEEERGGGHVIQLGTSLIHEFHFHRNFNFDMKTSSHAARN